MMIQCILSLTLKTNPMLHCHSVCIVCEPFGVKLEAVKCRPTHLIALDVDTCFM